MDLNPSFGADQRFTQTAKRVTDMLWETTGGNFSEAPKSYLEALRHEFSDGKVSMLELIDRVDLGPSASYEQYCEVFDRLVEVNGDEFPNPELVTHVSVERLLDYETQDFAEAFDFADGDLSHKVEKFLRKTIASVYTKGVSDVTDSEGHPPCEANNYLLSENGTKFSGVFYDRGAEGNKTKKFPFTISMSDGTWKIAY